MFGIGETPEWMKLLNGEKAAAVPKDQEADVEETKAPEDVTNEGEAEKLLVAVKEKLSGSGKNELYHEFLTAITAEPVEYETAAAIVADYVDLASAFQTCYGGAMAAAAALAAPANGAAVVTEEVVENRGSAARIAQLVQLVFSNKIGHEKLRARMQQYASKRAQTPAFPRRLVLLRGPPGVGKSSWAEASLVEKVDDAAEDLVAAKLTHVCSTNDFFMQFVSESSDEMKYVYERASGAHEFANQARVRLAMEAAIEPLYVDNTNMMLWDMRPYVQLADRLGYVITVVAPHEITGNWKDINFLLPRCTAKRTARSTVDKAISAYEDIETTDDPRSAIVAAEPPQDEDGDEEQRTLLAPAAILHRFEQLLKEGENILRYVPPDGKGWGINGELFGEWHSFREKVDGSCTYDDGKFEWYTGEPETAWSFADIAMLDDLKKQTASLPQAALPSATSHPALFGIKATAPRGAPRKPVATAPAPKRTFAKGEHEEDDDEDKDMPAMSRKERFKQRVMMKVQEEMENRVAAKPGKPAAAVSQPAAAVPLPKPGVPTSQEEASAAAFLASVKSRLMEWDKTEQYHEFVAAVTGAVDARTVARILRGHGDLLDVFKKNFSPRADLIKIQAELEADEPHPPAAPLPGSLPPARGVKQELGTIAGKKRPAPSTPDDFSEPGDGPRSPMGPPPLRVKTELGYSVVKSEMVLDAPRPPSMPPGTRHNVTIGDDDDDDEMAAPESNGNKAKTLPWMRVKA